MRLSRPAYPSRRAIAAVELAVAFPILLVFLFGILEVGRLVEMNQILYNAAREGGRQASDNARSYDDVNTAVTNYLSNAGITNLSGLQVQVTNVTTSDSGPGTHGAGIADYDPSSASSLDRLRITVSLPFKNVRWLAFNLTTNDSTTLNGQAIWRSMKDNSYPTTVTAPSGF
jgi:Flp pilus assembly protein TadG